MRIGIYGGTFNPPHFGHLLLAEKTLEILELDKLIFVPAFIPPNKIGKKILPLHHRFKMLKIATSKKKYFEISDIELRRGGTSYTYETLLEFKKLYPKAKFFLIIGYDNFVEIHLWKNFEEIFKLCTVCVLDRNDVDDKASEHEKTLLKKIKQLKTPIFDISSSEIRKRVKNGLDASFYVPEKVEKYIKKHNLYLQ